MIADLSLMQVVAAIERRAEPDWAIALYRAWIRCQRGGTPLLHIAWFNLGAALSAAGDRADAIEAYQAALALRPDFYLAAANLGTLLEAAGKPTAALQVWGEALQTDAARLLLLNNRARLLEVQGNLAEAEAEMRRSLLIDPRQPDVIQHFVHIRQKLCAWPVLDGGLPGLSAEALLRHAGPMATLALTDDIDRQRAAGADWIARKTAPVRLALAPTEPYRHERIRLGYLSSDFCSHAMSYLIAELFERHDRTRFEVFGYCSSPDDSSPIRARVLAAFDQTRLIGALSDDAAARLIRQDEIDILIDLNGLTCGVRAQLLRHRPAPVQATYLGFVGPVPLPELDYMFCDERVVPPATASRYEPTPLAIGVNYQANDSHRTIAPPMTRAAAGLPEDRFVFCCFSNHYKLTPQMFDAWMEILRGAEPAILWMVGDNEWARRNLRDHAAASGIDPARILFAPRIAPDLYMARLALADAFLDTFPYNAGTIASDAIRMGVPLVTLCGQSFAARMAASLLTAVGAPEGISQSIEAYVDIAVTLARSPAIHAAYKGRLTAQSWQRGIGDSAAFTRAFEATLQRIAKRPPSAACFTDFTPQAAAL